jgi:hypothetical protein
MYLNFNSFAVTVNPQVTNEWVHGSGISPEITALNVKWIDSPNKIARKLGWKRYNHTPGWLVENINLRTGQQSPICQFKPEKPFVFPGKDGKEDEEAKYLSSKLGYDAIALQTPDPDHWPEVVKNPKIPIAIIEGTKKTASALTCGIIGLALLGVEMGLTSSAKGTKKRELVPNLDVVAVPGRVFIFGFDMDMDVKAGVRGALRTLAKALIARGCTVLVAGWDSQYKGIDDLKVACGEEAVKDAIANAEPFDAWDKRWKAVENEQLARKILSRSYPAETTVTDRYLDASSLPAKSASGSDILIFWENWRIIWETKKIAPTGKVEATFFERPLVRR